tara:strand:- start:1046 stop:1738 length:693 start_codon:yes stop_codon:yes gene_type:complete
MTRIHYVSAHFGGPIPWKHKIFSKDHNISVNYYHDLNTPSRHLSMHPRLKSKIPKMLEWKYVKAEWYVWIDSSIKLKNIDLSKIILETAKDKSLCLFKHTQGSSILEEANSVRAQINTKNWKNNHYFLKRYSGEPILEQLINYYGDKDFVDNKLFSMTFFAYHYSAINLMKEWFLHNTIWSIEDQISFPYLLQKSGLKYALFNGTILDNTEIFNWDWNTRENHFSEIGEN